MCGVATTKPRVGWNQGPRVDRACAAGGGRGARGLSQPLSQCKHVLIEIRSSGYNSFADVAARPPLSFSLGRTPHQCSLSLRGVPLRTPRRPGSFPSSASVSRLCFLSRLAFHWLRGFAPSSITHFPFRGKEGCQGFLSYPETGQSHITICTGNYM